MSADIGGTGERQTAEQRTRVVIDAQLFAAGWVVRDRRGMNLFAGQGVAVHETVMRRGTAGRTT